MMQDKYSVLKQYFGYTEFRGKQDTVIDSILGGRDVLCVMPTGAGKSICYQVPALLLPGVTLVVSPLVSLMMDQVSALCQAGCAAAYLNSSLSNGQYMEALRRMENGAYKIVYVAPERLMNARFLEACSRLEISLVAVDESHCVSQWGPNFRPDYLKIDDFISKLPRKPVLGAFTATATPQVRRDIREYLGLKDPVEVTTGFDRPNLSLSVELPKSKAERMRILLYELHKRSNASGIIYCATRKATEELCAELEEHGISVTRYHAGLSDEERRRNQEDFVFDRKKVIVATNAFGMGIDKSNVSFVVHYNMPKSIEEYYQEAGRAGRDGNDADCILLYMPADVRLNEWLIQNSDRNAERTEEEFTFLREQDLDRLRKMERYCRSRDCLRHRIRVYFGESAPEYCGNCSNCRGEYDSVDISAEVRKIIHCIYGNGQRYGIGKICAILLGTAEEYTGRVGFRTMADCTERELKQYINEMLSQGYLERSRDEYPVLVLSGAWQQVAGRELEVEMLVPAQKHEFTALPITGEDKLVAELKQLRLRLSREKHVPPYMIFSDKVLMELAHRRPRNQRQLLNISGIGEQKAKDYGSLLLELVERVAPAPHGLAGIRSNPAQGTDEDHYEEGKEVVYKFGGRARIESRVGDKIILRFPDGRTRKLLLSVARNAGSLRPAEAD